MFREDGLPLTSKKQETNPAPKAGARQRDETADNSKEKNEESVICQESACVNVNDQPGDVEDTWL